MSLSGAALQVRGVDTADQPDQGAGGEDVQLPGGGGQLGGQGEQRTRGRGGGDRPAQTTGGGLVMISEDDDIIMT